MNSEEISADDTTHANIGCSGENDASINEIYPNTAKKKIYSAAMISFSFNTKNIFIISTFLLHLTVHRAGKISSN
jgi:hypothetical protein